MLLGLGDGLAAIVHAFRSYKSPKDLVDIFLFGFLAFSLLYMAWRLLRETFPKAPRQIPPSAP